MAAEESDPLVERLNEKRGIWGRLLEGTLSDADAQDYKIDKFHLPASAEISGPKTLAVPFEPMIAERLEINMTISSEALYEEALAIQEQWKFWLENPDERPSAPDPVWQEAEDRYSGASIEVTHSGKYIVRGAYDGDIWLDPENAVGMAIAILKDVKTRFPDTAR
jgi:hypothetical protein